MIEVAIGELERGEVTFAAELLGRAYRDTPITVAILGKDPVRRMRGAKRLVGDRVTAGEHTLVARRGGWIVGVCGMTPPGRPRRSPAAVLRMVPALLRAGPNATWKLLRMAAEWEKRAPNERHWHLGPVGVEPALQNMAVGSRMMGFCTRMDTERGMAWLETDKLENVRFFTRFGFAVVDEAEILRLPNWFMRREPGRQ